MRSCALSLAVLLAPAVSAQVDDPLYPLDIGAVWEFEVQRFYMGGYSYMDHRERREVVGDTVLDGQTYRVMRVLTGPGNAAGWSPSGRCAVRVDRSPETPVIEWVQITGSCNPREQGMALSDVVSGSFQVSILGDAFAFSAGTLNGWGPQDWRLVEGLGPYGVRVYSDGAHYTDFLTYAHIGDVEVGRAYEPGWWLYLVGLNEGDRYQYRDAYYGPGGSGQTFEEWLVRGDTVLSDTVRVLVEQYEYAGDGHTLIRQSLCALEKGMGGFSMITLQGGACTGVRVGEIWYYRRLGTVEALGGVYPGSYTSYGFSGTSYFIEYALAEGIGYVRYRQASGGGPIGSGSGSSFTLHYAVVNGVTYGTPIVAGEPEPAAQGPVLRAHPNPFVTVLTLDLDGTRPAIVDVEVLDVLGRRMLVDAVEVPGRHRLDLSTMPAGGYLIRLVLEDGSVISRRVTKLR